MDTNTVTMYCGCVIEVSLSDHLDYGYGGELVEVPQYVESATMISPCRTHLRKKDKLKKDKLKKSPPEEPLWARQVRAANRRTEEYLAWRRSWSGPDFDESFDHTYDQDLDILIPYNERH